MDRGDVGRLGHEEGEALMIEGIEVETQKAGA